MAVDVKYNGFRFPDPQPFVGISDSPVFTDGEVDSSSLSFDIVGKITGLNLSSLERQKRDIVTGLSSAFKTLQIGSGSYNYIQPISINFQNSNLSTILPYSITLQGREVLDGNQTLFTGLTDLVDSWSFVEQNNLVVQASHSVSAKGNKIGASDPIDLARQFVTGRLGFNNFSVFLSGHSGFLVSRVEEIDQFRGNYGITDVYVFSTTEEDVFPSGLLSTNTQIGWTKDGGLTVRLDGSIQGGLTGHGHPVITTGMFSAEDAKYYASKALERSRSDFESGIYGSVFQSPKTYQYQVDEESNLLSFSFDFADPSDPRTQDVIHDYSVTVNASKDNNVIEVGVNGQVYYNTNKLLFDTGAPETNERYLAVSGEFETINFRALAIKGFSDFIKVVTGYATSSGINSNPTTATINKDPFASNISYSYTYDNNFDISTGELINPRFSITKEHSIRTVFAEETINGGYSTQTGYITIPSLTIQGDAELRSGANAGYSLGFFSGLLENYARQYGFTGSGILTQDSFETGNGTLNINKTLIFPNE